MNKTEAFAELEKGVYAALGKALLLLQRIGADVIRKQEMALTRKTLLGPVLERFQRLMATFLPGVRFPGLARISFSIENSEEDVDTLIHVLSKIARQSRYLKQKEVQQQMNDFIKASAIRVYA